MNPVSLEYDPLEQLAEEFLARLRRGERPALAEYSDKHPDLAERIRKLFPALMVLEELGSVDGQAGGSEVARAALKGQIPARLGEYRILREVGRGGMGIVYEAVQESLGRHVALKVLPFHSLLGPTRVERFRREAKAAARLHHTNIVPVFGVGEQDGIHYYAMQFISGQGVDDVLKEVRRLRGSEGADSNRTNYLAASVAEGLLSGQFPDSSTTPDKKPEDRSQKSEDTSQKSPDRNRTSDFRPLTSDPSLLSYSSLSSQPEARYFRSVAETGIQVAEALAYAHREGVLHRDVKPSNLLLDTSGRVWVTDFGLAKAEDSDDLTRTGDMVGTLYYMAPERLQGQADPRSDVYGLGVTLYEMLTLQPAFAESNRPRLIERIAHHEPVAPRKLDGRIPRDLETIVLKAMAKEPAARYPSADDLAQDLRRVLADRPIQARRVSSFERMWRWCRRNPGLASALSLVAAALVMVAVVSTLSAVWLKIKSVQLTEAERLARLREAEALVGQAHGTRLSHRPGQRIAALDSLGKAAAIGRELGQRAEWFDQLRNEAIAALALPDVHITQEFGSWPPGTVWADLSDDFEWYVRTSDKGSCTICRVADDQVVAELPELGEPAQAAFGPGRILAVVAESSRRFQLWDLSGDEPALRWEENGIWGWNFRHDGRLLALSHTDGAVSIRDVASGARLGGLMPLERGPWLAAVLHPTEPFVAVCSYWLSNLIQIYDWRKGTVVVEAKPPWPSGSSGPAWSPDGRTLLVAQGDFDKRIQEYAFDSGRRTLQPIRPALESTNRCSSITYNPAGDRFVCRGWESKIDLFDAISGRLLFTTHSQPMATPMLRFDRTGQRVAAGRVGDRNERIGLWSVADGREYRALVHSGRGEIRGSPAVHPRGRLAAIGWTDGVALFDLETGRELAHLPISTSPYGTWTTFDGAGNLLTNGFEGCFRWPVRPDPATPGRLHIGPPQRLPFNPGNSSVSASHDGQVIAQCMWTGYGEAGGAWILHPNSRQPRAVVEAGHSVGWGSVSANGRWVAFNVDGRINVYDAAKAQRVWQLPAGEDPSWNGRFTPDGDWLVLDGGRRYTVGSWEPGPQFCPGALIDVSPDSTQALLAQSNGIYRLVELASGRELAQLEDPEQNVYPAAFTPDGTKLVVAAKNGLRVWDLRRIREELDKLGLDWEAPSYVAADAASSPSASLELQVDSSTLRQLKIPNAFEAEELQVLRSRDCSWVGAQDMAKSKYDGTQWSKGRQLFCYAKQGGYVDLQVDLSESGDYQIDIYLTKAPDYGKVRVLLDGKDLEKTFDGFQKVVVPPEKVAFGKATLTKGRHTLRFQAVDKNPQSTNYYMGIDCLMFTPVSPK